MTTLKHIRKLNNFYFQWQIHKYGFAQNMPVCALLKVKPQSRNVYYIGKDFLQFSEQTQTPRQDSFWTFKRGFSQLF